MQSIDLDWALELAGFPFLCFPVKPWRKWGWQEIAAVKKQQ